MTLSCGREAWVKLLLGRFEFSGTIDIFDGGQTSKLIWIFFEKRQNQVTS